MSFLEEYKGESTRNGDHWGKLGCLIPYFALALFAGIRPRRFREMRMAVRKKFDLTHDLLRHTFISMLVGAFRSVGDAALQAGNSEAIIRKNYLDVTTKVEAEKFWRIVPGGTSLTKEFVKKDGRYIFGGTSETNGATL